MLPDTRKKKTENYGFIQSITLFEFIILLLLFVEEQAIFHSILVKLYIHNENSSLISGYGNANVFSCAFGSGCNKIGEQKINKTRRKVSTTELSGILCNGKPVIKIFMKFHYNKFYCEKILNTSEIQKQHQSQRSRIRQLNSKFQ